MSAEQLVADLTPTAPDDTYLADMGYERCWIGARWDIGERQGQFDIYRKGNYVIQVGSLNLAVAIVKDRTS